MQRILSGDVGRYCKPAATYFDDTAAREAEALERAAELDLGLEGIVDTDLDPGECSTWDELCDREMARLGVDVDA